MCAAALSALFLPAADSPWGGVTLHLNVQEDVPIVLPNCGAVVPFKTRNLPICSTCDVKLTGLWWWVRGVARFYWRPQNKKKRGRIITAFYATFSLLLRNSRLGMEPPASPWWLIYFCFQEGKSYCDCIVLWQQLAHNLSRLCRIKGEPSCCLKSLWSKVTPHLFFLFFSFQQPPNAATAHPEKQTH